MSTFPFHNVCRKTHRRVFLVLSLFIATLSLLLAGRGAQAQTLEITVGGTVTSIRDTWNYFPTLGIGTAFSTTFTLPIDTPNQSTWPTAGSYAATGTNNGFTGHVGDLAFAPAANTSHSLYVTDGTGSQMDYFTLSSHDVSLAGPAVLPPFAHTSVSVYLFGTSNSLINSPVMPSADLFQLSNFSSNPERTQFLLFSGVGNQVAGINGTITSVSARVLPIPEPGTLAYAALGLVGFCAWRRRRV